MKIWWGARTGWQKVGIAIGVYVLAQVTLSGPLNQLLGGAGVDGSASAPRSLTTGIFVLMGSLLVVCLIAVAMMARNVATSLQDTRFASTPEFRMPGRVGGEVLPAAFTKNHAGPEETVAALEDLGFRRAGSYDVDLADHQAIFACLISPEGSTMAVVTPVHLTMQSDIDGKLVVTADRKTGATYAPWVLHQVAKDRTPHTVWTTHRKALDVVLQRGLVPTVFDPATAASVAAGIDYASVAHFKTTNQIRSVLAGFAPGAHPPVDGSPRSQDIIERWLAFPDRWVDTP